MRAWRKLATTALGSAYAALAGCSLVAGSNAGIVTLEHAPSPVSAPATCAKYAGWAASAPVVLGLTPLAALAWATPWVDLPLAADIATAPAVGLGYAVEATIGFPLYLASLCGEMDDDDERKREPWRPGDPSCVPLGFVVAHELAAACPRAASPLTPALESYYAIPEGAEASLARAIDEAARASEGETPVSVRLEGIAAALELSPADEEGPRPLVLMTPPSEGIFAARYLAARSARRGFHAAVIVPDEEVFLDTALDAKGIERKLRAWVVATRTVLAVLSKRPDVDASRTVYLGISAGGIFGAVLLAVEPRVKKAALVFPGGDLPAIVATSTEHTARDYREAWASRGVPLETLRADMAREVKTDPILLARHVDPGRVLIFVSDRDTQVPVETGDALRRALGSPETWVLSGDHETASLCFGFVLRTADEFLLDER